MAGSCHTSNLGLDCPAPVLTHEAFRGVSSHGIHPFLPPLFLPHTQYKFNKYFR